MNSPLLPILCRIQFATHAGLQPSVTMEESVLAVFFLHEFPAAPDRAVQLPLILQRTNVATMIKIISRGETEAIQSRDPVEGSRRGIPLGGL